MVVMFQLDVTRMPVWYVQPLGRQKRIKHLAQVHLSKRAKAWCDDMFGRDAVRIDHPPFDITKEKPMAVIAVFPSEIDAMHFKLRWDGAHALV
jgi:hypothetical protein